MKRVRKGQKMLLAILVAIVIIIAVVIAVNIINKISKNPEEPEETRQVVQLPETTYSDMQVKNIVMELLKGNAQDGSDETMVSFDIYNTTENKVEEQYFDAVLIGADDTIIAQMPNTYMQELAVGEVHEVSVVYKGDLTATTQIKLIEK